MTKETSNKLYRLQYSSYHQRLLVLLLVLLSLFPWRSNPKITNYKLRDLPEREIDTKYVKTKRKIVLIHNFYRARVYPPASNMLRMKWHKGAERLAQKWANACQFLIHDKTNSRKVDGYGACGQNILVSSAKVDWMFVAKAWYMEHENFTFGSRHNNLKAVGHYTQMVWYNSHRIGCGYRYCGKEVVRRPFHNYVCNYCPIGNYADRLGRPYSVGKPCAKCKGHCKYKKLCTNACPYSDYWINCAELNSTYHSWLCKDERNQGHKSCRATCKCPYAIR